MSWIESHDTLARHPKTRRLVRALNIPLPQAIGHLHLLWWWALEYAEHGDLSAFDAADIADAVMWEGDPSAFVQALTAAGFMDADQRIHDWQDYAGRLLEQRKANAARQAAWTAKKKGQQPPPNSPPSNTNGHITSRDISPNSYLTVSDPSANVLTVPSDNTNDQTVTESTDRTRAREAEQRASFDAEFSNAHPDPATGGVIERPIRPAYKPSGLPSVRAFVDTELKPVYPFRDGIFRSPEKAYASVAGIPPDRWPELLTAAQHYAASDDAADNKAKDLHNWIDGGDCWEWARGPARKRGSPLPPPTVPTGPPVDLEAQRAARWTKLQERLGGHTYVG